MKENLLKKYQNY